MEKTSTIEASALGYSGSWANNSITSTVEAKIGDHVTINTEDLQVTALNKELKDIVGGNNIRAGSGWRDPGNNAESVTDISNYTHALIGDYATVRVNGDVNNPGNFLLSARNDVEGADEVLLDTGGVFAGSGVESPSTSTRTKRSPRSARTTRFTRSGTSISWRRRMRISHARDVAHVGLAGGAGVDSSIYFNDTNSVAVGGSTEVLTLGSVNMLAGKDTSGARDYFKLTSHGDDLTRPPCRSAR